MLSIEEFIIEVYCCIDDHFKAISAGKRIRRRGFDPVMSDAEVITMEIVGEFPGMDTDKGICEYFHRHWLRFFPKLGCRTTWVRRGANLWYRKQKLQQVINSTPSVIGSVWSADSLFWCVVSSGPSSPKYSVDRPPAVTVLLRGRSSMVFRGICS